MSIQSKINKFIKKFPYHNNFILEFYKAEGKKTKLELETEKVYQNKGTLIEKVKKLVDTNRLKLHKFPCKDYKYENTLASFYISFNKIVTKIV